MVIVIDTQTCLAHLKGYFAAAIIVMGSSIVIKPFTRHNSTPDQASNKKEKGRREHKSRAISLSGD